MTFLRFFFIIFALLLGVNTPFASAQTFTGHGIHNNETSSAVDNSCRMKVNDLREGLTALRNDLSAIKACTQQGKLAVRSGPTTIICRDISQPHHLWTGTIVKFGTSANGGYGDSKNLQGPQGDPGRNVRCEPDRRLSVGRLSVTYFPPTS